MTVYLLRAGGDLDGSFAWSINGAAVSVSSETAVESAWSAAWVAIFADATLKPYIPANTSLTFTSTSTASATLHQTTKTETTHASVGTSASPALGYGSCSIITLRTAFATRWGRGRWYFPGLATNALATNGYHYNATSQSALAAALTSAMTSFNATAGLAIKHPHVIAGGPAQYSTTPVQSGDVSDQIADQRRRGRQRKPIRVNWSL